jgi:hypothetical protein
MSLIASSLFQKRIVQFGEYAVHFVHLSEIISDRRSSCIPFARRGVIWPFLVCIRASITTNPPFKAISNSASRTFKAWRRRSKRGISRGRSKLSLLSKTIAHRVPVLLGSQARNKQGKAILFGTISKPSKARCNPMISLEPNRRSPPFSVTYNKLVTAIIGITMVEEDRQARSRHSQVLSVTYTAAVAPPHHPLRAPVA